LLPLFGLILFDLVFLLRFFAHSILLFFLSIAFIPHSALGSLWAFVLVVSGSYKAKPN